MADGMVVRHIATGVQFPRMRRILDAYGPTLAGGVAPYAQFFQVKA